MSAVETVRFPAVETYSIYKGKFKDRAPDIRAAGKLTSSGESAASCLKPKDDRPPSPPVIRRFRNTFRPDPARKTIFYGKANDPHNQWAEELRHGLSTHPSITVKELVNPFPKTLLQQRAIDVKEKHYASHVRAPLGKIHDQAPGLPAALNITKFTFGMPTMFDSGGGDLINPNKTYAQVEEEGNVAHDHYVLSHKDYFVGEHVNRSYTCPEFHPDKTYGKPTPHDATGKMMRNTLKWRFITDQNKGTKIVNKRVDDFREKSQPQLGQALDPIKDTMRVGPDHTFGVLYKPDEYGAGDLIHNRVPGNYLRGRDQQRGLVAAMRQQLKKLNYHSFPDLIHAFKFYDKEGKGKIDIHDLREACIHFHLPVDVWLLEQVFDYCDVDRDGQINYGEFANFLNWKEKLPAGFADIPLLEKAKLYTRKTGKIGLDKNEDLQETRPQSAEFTPRRVQKQIDKSIADHHTSTGMINAVAGPCGIDTRNFRTYGVPTVRSDLPPPTMRRVDDRTNYGDQADAYALTNPSLYSTHGVYEKDLLIPRTKEEIMDIYQNIGVRMTGETLDKVYRHVASEHPKGHVSVESFRNCLDEVQAAMVASREHPLAV